MTRPPCPTVGAGSPAVVVNHDIDVAHLEMSDTAALAVIGPMLADALHRADGDGDS